MASQMRVALIDDDEAVLDSLRLYLGQNDVATSCFATADAFLEARHGLREFDCVVADVRMPGISGLDLVSRIASEAIPIILITGHGDIDMAVSAVKRGAFDFIEKPFDESRLLETIKNAVSHGKQRLDQITELSNLRTRFNNLTGRQRQVMALAVTGLSNKEIGDKLGISARTVEIHRAWMMEKMGARNLAELVRMDMRLGNRF
jgi:two-component system, LuxR family, response regulator FixJ